MPPNNETISPDSSTPNPTPPVSDPTTPPPQPGVVGPTPPAATPGASPGKSKKPMMIILIVVVLLALGAAAYVFMSKDSDKSSDSKTDTSKSTSSNTNSNSSNNTTTSTADKIDTICYSFTVPTPHEELPTENTCDTASLHYGDSYTSSIDVFASTNGYKNISELVSRWKKDHNSVTITKEEDTKVGGLAAKKITYTSGGVGFVAYVVPTTGKDYKIQAYPIDGFFILGSYSATNKGSIEGTDSIIASWAWK